MENTELNITGEAETEKYVASESNVLSEEQVVKIENREEGVSVKEALDNIQEEVTLDSDKTELPEKYAGKSAEEIYRLMSIENDFKNNQSNETNNEEIKTETEIENTPERLEVIKEYTQKVQENGGNFSDEMYEELKSKGISKEEADLTKAGIEANQEKQITNLFTEAETTREGFQEAGLWAKENWSEQRVAEYNEAVDAALESGNEVIQKTLIRSLTESYQNGKETKTETYHSNNVPKTVVNAYSSKSEYFRDQQNPRFLKDRSYREMVENKFLKTDKSNW